MSLILVQILDYQTSIDDMKMLLKQLMESTNK